MNEFNIENWKKEFNYIPLGVRINNPGCLRYSSSRWNGLKDNYKSYCAFVDYQSGVRALTLVLMKYLYKYNLFDISNMMTKYAPADDGNFPYVYSNFIVSMCGLRKIDRNIKLIRVQLPMVIYSITCMENGSEYIKLSRQESYRRFLFDEVRKYIDEYLDQVVYPAKGKIEVL